MRYRQPRVWLSVCWCWYWRRTCHPRQHNNAWWTNSFCQLDFTRLLPIVSKTDEDTYSQYCKVHLRPFFRRMQFLAWNYNSGWHTRHLSSSFHWLHGVATCPFPVFSTARSTLYWCLRWDNLCHSNTRRASRGNRTLPALSADSSLPLPCGDTSSIQRNPLNCKKVVNCQIVDLAITLSLSLLKRQYSTSVISSQKLVLWRRQRAISSIVLSDSVGGIYSKPCPQHCVTANSISRCCIRRWKCLCSCSTQASLIA